MHIALLTDGIYPYVIGGMQRHSFYLAKFFAAAGHRVDLYHVDSKNPDARSLDLFSEAEKANIRSFPIAFPSMGEFPGHYIRESYEFSRQVWRKFQEQPRPDFIYVKGFAGWELLNQKQKGAQLPPVGVNFHGYEMFQPAASWKEWLKYALVLRAPVKFCVAHADYLFSYGGKITGIIESLGVPRRKIVELPAGIEPKWLAEKPAVAQGPRKLAFVGRYERRKGIQELNKALERLRGYEMEFHFIGAIPVRHRLRGEKFVYHGAVTDSAKLSELLRGFDILVCPSHSEGMPNVILEAMASGCAIIATDVGAVSLMVNAGNGWLIPPSDVRELEAALTASLRISDSELLAKRSASLEKSRAFTWDKIIVQTIDALSLLIDQRS